MQLSHVVVVNWKDSSHPEAGGAEVFCENVARELATSGVRVTYLTSRPGGAPARSETDGYAVRRVGRTYSIYPLVLLWLFRHRRVIDGVIDSQNGIPFFSPLAVGRRVAVAQLIHHVHQDQFGMYFPPAMAWIGRLLEGLGARTVYRERAICTVSPSTRTEVRRRLRLRGPVYVTPNGTASTQHPGVARTERPSITCVGRLTRHKRWDAVVDAVAELVEEVPDLTVHLVGAGPEHDALAAQVERLGLIDHVILHGFVTEARRDVLLASAWLTVSASAGEGWGLSMIEAAAQGVPAVAVDVPGLRDSIRDGVTGWLTTDTEFAASIAMALKQLDDPDVADAYAEACRAWAGSLQWGATAARFRAVLQAETRSALEVRRRRAARQDSTAAVTMTREVAATVDTHLLRGTDQTTFCAACVDRTAGPFKILLHGADEHGATSALLRLGVNPLSDAMQIQLCRSSDLVQWHAGALPHNEPSRQPDRACPHDDLSRGELAELARTTASVDALENERRIA